MVKKTGQHNFAVRFSYSFFRFSASDISSRAVMRTGGRLISFRKSNVRMCDSGRRVCLHGSIITRHADSSFMEFYGCVVDQFFLPIQERVRLPGRCIQVVVGGVNY